MAAPQRALRAACQCPLSPVSRPGNQTDRAAHRREPRTLQSDRASGLRLWIGFLAALVAAGSARADLPAVPDGWSQAAATPISTSFEAGESGAYALGPLGGQHGWQVTAGTAAVMASTPYARTGTRGVQLATVSQPLSVAHVAYGGSETGVSGVVYFDFEMKIRSMSGKRVTINGNDLFGLVAARTFVIDFDLPVGQTGAVRAWERYGKVAFGNYTLGIWHRLTGRVDYGSGLVQVRFDLGPPATLDFRESYTPSASGTRPAGVKEYHELRFNLGDDLAAGTADVALDNVYVGTAPPSGVTFPAPGATNCVHVVQPSMGSIALSPPGGRYTPGTVVTATFTPLAGYRHSAWLGAVLGTGSTRTFVVSDDVTVGAETSADPAHPPAVRLIPVASIAALKTALASALPGDVIEVAEGTYPDAGEILIERGGVPGYPVTVRARTRGLVTFTGAANVRVREVAHVVLEGFDFETGGGPIVETESARDVRITRNLFRPLESVPGDWVRIAGSYEAPEPLSDHNRVDHNRFEVKTQPGHYVVIDGSDLPDPRSSQYDRIDRNHFRDTRPRIVNGKEAVRVGWSGMSRTSGFTTVEANLFEDCDGDPEIVSIKTSDDLFRFNTIRHSQGVVALRCGNRGTVEGNFFLGERKTDTGGVRLHGDDHRVFNNYFEGLTGTGYSAPLAIPNGDADPGSTVYTNHFRVHRAVVAFNTLVANTRALEIGFDAGGQTMAPVDVALDDNLVTGDEGSLVRIFTPAPGTQWQGNLMWPTGSAVLGIAPNPGITVANPQLGEVGELWRIGAQSVAVDAAGAGLPYVVRDMDGQVRSTPDIGADEFDGSGVQVFPLQPGDVGPDAFEDESVTEVRGPFALASGLTIHANMPNPFTTRTRIEFSVARAGEVELAIYDVEGRRVALLAQGRYPAGRHQAEWRAAEAPAGIYFCRLRLGAAVATRPLLHLR
jgi:poly(beta-D-mannuronate) lyase